MRKKIKWTKSELAKRKITCDYCGKEHYIKDGGWVITASDKVLCCSNHINDCLHRNWEESDGSKERNTDTV